MRKKLAGLIARMTWVALWLASATCSHGAEEPAPIVERMRAAYARLSGYEMRVESTTVRADGREEETRLRYRYRKPGKIRIDFLRPRKGWALVYPSERGRVRLRPSGVLGFLTLSLSPDNSLLTVWPGQQVTETGLGLLVENIARSVTSQRRGPVEVSRGDGELTLRVEAENHFLDGAPTRYEFRVDTRRWLPAGVHELLLQRGWTRRIRFRDLEVDPELPHALFELD